MSENKPNTPAYYAVIPANVRYCKTLKANAKLLYGELTALSNTQGYCWATNGYFADLYDVDNRAISDWLSQLQKHGFITVELLKNEQGTVRNIYITQQTPKEDFHQPVCSKTHARTNKFTTPPHEQIHHHNNTSLKNNTNNTLAPKGAINPAPEKKPKEDYSEFAAYCQQHGFEQVLKIPRLLTKEKVAAKRKDQNELAFYETVSAIDAYLKSVAPKMPYKDLNLVWKQFAFSDGCAYTKKAYNSLYSKVFGKDKESYTKNEIEALGAIWCVLEANTKTSTGAKASFEQVCGAVDVFFGKFPASRQNDTDLKLAFIRTDIETIIREIRGQAVQRTQPKGGVVVTQELVDGTIDLVRQKRERKQAEEQLMRDLGLIQ